MGYSLCKVFLLASSLSSSFVATAAPLARDAPSCRYLPSDSQWPATSDWQGLNSTVNGSLIASTLIAQVCHPAELDTEKCDALKQNWTFPNVHFQSSSSVMNPYWLNGTCDPYLNTSEPCTQGNIVEYSIKVSNAHHAAAGIKFAQDHNIRLVVKNTGHDFLGRSTGKGALGLWMQGLKDISVFQYNSTRYNGQAIKIGAGVQAFEAYAAADAHGVRMVGGSCPTVGLAGGYTQGAGHGPLNGPYGLAADNVLEWEVVTAQGEHVVATPYNEHSDLYWAFSGGGGGTYGVIISMTTKAHPDGPVAGATMLFNSSGIPADTFWGAIEKYHDLLPDMIANPGFRHVYTISNESFYLDYVTWPDHTAAEVKQVLQPFQDYLDSQNIKSDNIFSDDKGYFQHYTRYTPGMPYGIYEISELIGGQNVPASVMQQNNSALTIALRNIAQNEGWVMNGLSANMSLARAGVEEGQNSVHPAWRDSASFFNIVAPWDPTKPTADGVASETYMTNVAVPQLQALTPGGGGYINEGDFNNPHWKQDYFGSNYDQLLSIKKKYDPNDLFYAIASVGSTAWKVAGDGRLCRA